MTNFQVVIAGPHKNTGQEQSELEPKEESSPFEVRPNSRGGDKAVAKIDELAEIWDVVVEKLTTIAAKTKNAVEKSPYELETIEFNIGIEAGLEVGLVTKGNASVSVSFKKKD